MKRPLAPFALAAVLATSGVALAPRDARGAPGESEQEAEIATVRFSYEKWTRTGSKRYVLIPLPTAIEPGPLQDRVRSLFAQLVSAKRNSYGDARIAFKPDAAKTGVVYVYLDAAKRAYHPIVMAETVYTFTENGASSVLFPKFANAGWTRDDVPFPAYVLRLPLWQTLPPARYAGALVQLPDGSILPNEVALQRLKKGDRATVDALWSYVEKGPAPAALAAIKAAALLKLPDLERRLLPVLKSADASMRAAALDGLTGHDNTEINQALRAVMDADPEAKLRDRAAVLLSASKDPAFGAAAQYHALRSEDPKIVAQAAASLGESRQAEAGQRLLEVLTHADPGVRAAAIASLQKRGQHGALADRLDQKKLDAGISIEIARALAQGDDAASAYRALRFLAVNGKGEDSAHAATALAKHDEAPSYAALGKALKHAEGDTRRAAAESLRSLGKPTALPLLAQADVNDPESGAAVTAALRSIYAKQSLDFVLAGTRKKKSPVIRRAAVATLGAMVKPGRKTARKKILETLRELAQDGDALIRAAAVRSFAIMAAKDVRPDVLKLALDDAIQVKREAALALKAFPGPKANTLLLGYTAAKDPILLANAVEALGTLKVREAMDPVVGHLNHKDVRVRRAATAALVKLGQLLEKRDPLLSFFSERLFDDDPEVRLLALEGLKLVKHKRTVTAMAALLQDKEPRVRKATLLAMADTGDPSAIDAIGSGLEDDDLGVRRTALDAFRRLKRKEAVKLLTEYVKGEKDRSLAEEASRVIAALKGG